MPIKSFPGAITLVDNTSLALRAIKALYKEEVVGFDTETRPSFRKGKIYNAALMQISTEDRCFLFRLNKIGICTELKDFLESPDVLKVGLSLHDDFTVLRRTTHLEPQGFIDLQQMVHDYDIRDISLQKIYAIVFCERISKSQRLTNWEADKLTVQQQSYAALDAWACLRLYKYFQSGAFDPLASPYRHLPEPIVAKENI